MLELIQARKEVEEAKEVQAVLPNFLTQKVFGREFWFRYNFIPASDVTMNKETFNAKLSLDSDLWIPGLATGLSGLTCFIPIFKWSHFLSNQLIWTIKSGNTYLTIEIERNLNWLWLEKTFTLFLSKAKWLNQGGRKRVEVKGWSTQKSLQSLTPLVGLIPHLIHFNHQMQSKRT